MNAKNIKYTTLLCMLLACTAVKAETYHLTLEASVELAKEKSYTMQNLKENLKIAHCLSPLDGFNSSAGIIAPSLQGSAL